MKKNVLRKKPAEKIREDLAFDLHDLMGDLLSAMNAVHLVARVGAMDLRYASALSADVDTIGREIREAGEKFRKIQAGVEMLTLRPRRGRQIPEQEEKG